VIIEAMFEPEHYYVSFGLLGGLYTMGIAQVYILQWDRGACAALPPLAPGLVTAAGDTIPSDRAERDSNTGWTRRDPPA
jgi:hypothetical protein